MATPPLNIVDAHHHLWNLEDLKYSWLYGPKQQQIHLAGNLDSIRTTYTVKDFIEDNKNQHVIKSVHVQAECDDEIGEAKWLQSLANEFGFPHAIVAHGNPAAPNFRETLDVYRTLPNVRGIRQLLNWHDTQPKLRVCEENFLKNEQWIKGLELLAEYGFSFDLQVWQHQLSEAADLVALADKIQFILNHTGFPFSRGEEAFKEWKEGMEKIAKNPNIAVKISGLGMTDHHWTVDSIRPYVITTIQIFGVDRSMFASNFPIDKLLSDYDTLYNAFKEIVKDFSQADIQKLFHDNACRYYRI